MRPFVALAVLALPASASAQSFVNWESPHVNALDLAPGGERLLAANTPDNRLEVFTVTGTGGLVHEQSIPVGLDPVSVRARTATEAWVVNHVSDTVSVVDLATGTVTATLLAGDEPADVVFAGAPERAFVSVAQRNQVWVFDPAALAAAPVVIDIAGEDPRALATDGTSVYVAIFESGNGTTIIPEAEASVPAINPYPGDPNPAPNSGLAFDPPIAGGLPTPPAVSQIVRRQSDGSYRDANGFDWSNGVTWDLHGHDVAVIDAATLDVSYVNDLMNLNMNLAVGPDGDVVVVGTEALNDVRFEPNLSGRFIRVRAARFAPGANGAATIVDLNPHLDYSGPTVEQALRDQSIGDPRGIAWSADDARLYVAGMGSNNLVVLDADLGRTGLVEVGAGPTAVVVNDADDRAYVLNKFDASVSVIDTGALVETGRLDFHDPTPAVIRDGRPFLYDTHATSGLGHIACASCHVDGRMDQLAWDLGNPGGAVKPFNQVCNFGLAGGCEDWHPMKGPMATQTLIGIIGTEPFHWRADREDLGAFSGAFESLMGDDAEPTPTEMAAFEAFVATLTMPPNPFRNLDDTLLNADLDGTGNPTIGENLYMNGGLDFVNCVTCHALPNGTNGQLTSANLLQEAQSMKIPQLRNLYEKTGFRTDSLSNNRGFGFIHDGSVDTLVEFLRFPGFNFQNDDQRRDVEAFLMSFSTDTHAGVGAQATVGGAGPDQTARRDALKAIADASPLGLVAKGVVNGEARGYRYVGFDEFRSDRAVETASLADLDAAALVSAITYTLVPAGSEFRIGVDRDGDGHLDRDELDACEDPADPASFPGDGTPGVCGCAADLDGSSDVGFGDVLAVIGAWGPCAACPEDLDASGDVGFGDILIVIGAWGPCP